MNEIDVKKDVKVAVGFYKEQLAGSERYGNRRDVLNVVLDNDKVYSYEEVDRLITKFMKGRVK